MDNNNSNNLFKLLVDFVYKESLTKFLTNKSCKSSEFFSLLNWDVLSDKNNDG
jgi:hypothetical protein